jgi:hypothetical protein
VAVKVFSGSDFDILYVFARNAFENTSVETWISGFDKEQHHQAAAMAACWVRDDRHVFVGAIPVGEVNPFGLLIGPKVVVAKIVSPLVIAAGFHRFPEAKRIVRRGRSRHLVLSTFRGHSISARDEIAETVATAIATADYCVTPYHFFFDAPSPSSTDGDGSIATSLISFPHFGPISAMARISFR